MVPASTVSLINVNGGTVSSASSNGSSGVGDIANRDVDETPLGSSDGGSGNESSDFVIGLLNPGGFHADQDGSGGNRGSEADMVASGMEEASTFDRTGNVNFTILSSNGESNLVTIRVGQNSGGDFLNGCGSPSASGGTGEGHRGGEGAESLSS